MSEPILPNLFPRLRDRLAAAPDEDEPGQVILFDQFRITPHHVELTPTEFNWARLFNGRHSPADILAASRMETPEGVASIQALIQRLDEALLLDSPRFSDFLDSPIREPSCIGCYAADPAEVREQFRGLFMASGGPGLPDKQGCRISAEGRLRACLVPHIDYARGGVTYGWGFKEIFERSDASLFVIIATSHYSPQRFTLTRKNFKTPLGIVETDQTYIDRLMKKYGDGLFDDPTAHLPEHSVELEVVLLQYLYEGIKPFRIVPLVVGSFFDCVHDEASPGTRPDIRRMTEALREVEAETDEPICYIISGDLAHIGPKFEDPEPVAEPFLSESFSQDQAILKQAEAVNDKGYFEIIAAEQDQRRICGLPPTWLTLQAARPRNGKLLHYGRHVHPDGFESVSFASMAFG